MKKIFLIPLWIALLVSFSACKKFLDVQPEDKLTQEQVKRSEHALNNVLNGIYLQMANPNIYGANLTMSIIECMAQHYSVENDQMSYSYFQRYAYGEVRARDVIAGIWESMYVQVLAANDFLDVLPQVQFTLPKWRENILRGEALALRAFHHFDLIRLWGPGPHGNTTSEISIPYSDEPSGRMIERLPESTVLDRVLMDLEEADSLLKADDPIISSGIVETTSGDVLYDFYTNRNYRMNYYAVKALQARVYLWQGNYDSARNAALEVIRVVGEPNEPGKVFRWINPDNVRVSYNPDRILSTEIIFGIYNRNMYTNYNAFYLPSLSTSTELRPKNVWLESFYESNGNDIRYTYNWKEAGGEKPGEKCFYKYAAPNLKDNPLFPIKAEFIQPLIRIAEMYYIAAECEAEIGDPQLGLNYLNTVRSHRGEMVPLPDNLAEKVALHNEILKEYRKEFFGEGQMFYYYKRRNIVDVPNAIAEIGTRLLTGMRFPLPQAELDARGGGQ